MHSVSERVWNMRSAASRSLRRAWELKISPLNTIHTVPSSFAIGWAPSARSMMVSTNTIRGSEDHVAKQLEKVEPWCQVVPGFEPRPKMGELDPRNRHPAASFTMASTIPRADPFAADARTAMRRSSP
jgi:hypothetical protein